MSRAVASDEDRRELAWWAAACAERALALFDAAAPSDPRPRAAVDAARAFADSGERTQQLRSVAWAALAAARDVGVPAAVAAARAAGYAAATPYLHSSVAPHQVRHVLSPAVYAARARELAADDPSVADDEIRWAVEHSPPAVRDVVRRLPTVGPGRSRLATLYRRLETDLRC